MDSITFFVPGIPQPGGSKRAFVNPKTGRPIITEDCTRSKDWRTAVRFAAAERCPAPLVGALYVTFVFHLPRPQGHYGTGAKGNRVRPSAPEYPAVRPDLTKLIRSTEDALKGIAWVDDSQIVIQLARKIYHTRVGAMILIQPAPTPVEMALLFEAAGSIPVGGSR